jgi:flagellar M-ring protein FliF
MAENAVAIAPPTLPGTDLVAGWRALPVRNKIATMVGAAASIAILAAAWMWSQAPDYKILFAQIPDKDGGAIIAALNQQNIPYKMAEAGGAILVPAPLVHETRLKLASAGLPRGGNVGFDLIDNQKFGATQFQEQVNYQRALEGELMRSIQSLAAVQSARVHLAIPKPSVFMREQNKPTASVLLSVYPGKTLDTAQVGGIMHLVASSLPDLAARNVSVVDQNGTLLSPKPETAGGNLDPTQLSYVQQVEQAYIKRIMEVMTPLYGENNVRAQVTADIDFNIAESTTEAFKPNQNKDDQVIRSQQTSESTNGAAAASGVPGALSNQPPGGASAPVAGTPTNPAGGAGAKDANAQSRRESVTNYETGKEVRHVKAATGSVKRLSAAIVVNHKKPGPGAKPGALPVPLPAEEIAKIDKLVKEAIGFSEERKDSINVVNAPFTPREVEVLPEVPLWKQPDTLSTAKDIGKQLLIAGVVLYILLGVLRPMLLQILAHRPPPPPEPTAEETAAAAADPEHPGTPALPGPIENARALAKQDPRIVANVVRGWVNGNE